MRCIVPKIQPDPLSKICAKENCSQIVVTMCLRLQFGNAAQCGKRQNKSSQNRKGWSANIKY